MKKVKYNSQQLACFSQQLVLAFQFRGDLEQVNGFEYGTNQVECPKTERMISILLSAKMLKTSNIAEK